MQWHPLSTLQHMRILEHFNLIVKLDIKVNKFISNLSSGRNPWCFMKTLQISAIGDENYWTLTLPFHTIKFIQIISNKVINRWKNGLSFPLNFKLKWFSSNETVLLKNNIIVFDASLGKNKPGMVSNKFGYCI